MLVGRERELAALERFLDGAAREGTALVVVGDAGMGKTALLDVAERQAGQRATRVLRASGVEFEAELSFAGLHQLLLPVAAVFDDLPAVHRAAVATALGLERGEPPERLLLATATLALLRRLARAAPLLLVVDDLQWLDRASAIVLSLVARRLGDSRVGLLLAQRSAEESFFDRVALPTLALAPLDEVAAGELVRTLHPTFHPSVRQRIVAEGGGNPLALLELPKGVTAAQETGADFLPATLPLTDRLRRLFTQRVAALPAPSRRLLLLAALDTGARTGLMATVAASDDDLSPAEAGGLVSVDPREHRVTFTHPLIRAAVVDAAPAPDRRAAHRRLAVLATDPDVRALHLAEAALGPDDRAAAQLVRVADNALERGDATQAVSLLLRAVDLTLDPAARARLLAEAAFIGAHVTGSLTGAGALLARARSEHPDVAETLRASAAAAAQMLNSDGDIDTAHRVLVGALAHIPVGEADRRSVEDALMMLLLVCAFGGRPELWTAFDEAAARFDPVLSERARVVVQAFGDPVRTNPAQLRELDRMVADLDGETNPMQIVDVARARWYVGEVPREPLERVAAAGRAGQGVALAAHALVLLAVDSFTRGRWDEAGTLADEALASCEENGYDLLLWAARLPRMLLAAARADSAYLEDAHARMRQWALPRNASAVRTFTAYVDGLAALGAGRYREALETYASISRPGSFPAHEQTGTWRLMDVVEAAVCSGEVEAARAHVRAAAEVGIPGLSPRCRFLYDAATVLACGDGYPDRFDELLADPVTGRWPFERARLELAYGERLRRDRAMRQARPHLERARELFGALGATPWAARAGATLRATGATRRVGGHESGLTPQELQIARLAASGLTNRQIGAQLFLSPRTVGAHLYRIFPKLRIASRAALRDALTAHGY